MAKVVRQGKAVVEWSAGNGLIVMLPDGQVEGVRTARQAQALVQAWSNDHLSDAGADVGVTAVEWRGRAAEMFQRMSAAKAAS